MGEYEPEDSRDVTLKQERAPGEPPRTGPREGETRQPQAGHAETELDQDERGEEAEQVADANAEEALREAAMERDTQELNDAASGDRND